MDSEEMANLCDVTSSHSVSKSQVEGEIFHSCIPHIASQKSNQETSSEVQNQEKEVLDEICASSLDSMRLSAAESRIRKRRRPYSPEPISNNTHKTLGKAKLKRKGFLPENIVPINKTEEIQTFSCDRCHSSYVVNPARCRLSPNQLKKKPSRRRKFDPVTKKILNLCNACGIALSRPPKQQKKIISSIEDRDKYLVEAASFANAIAERVHNPIARRLFCPSFKTKPCGCIQTYLTHQGESEQDNLESRVETLLDLLKTANHLGRRKSIFPKESVTDLERNSENTINASGRRQQHQDFEQFVLETRQLLRDKLHLCERACQRLLLYSNNFLHKKLKSEQGSRISRQPGRSHVNQLKSIDELSSISCCSDNCSRIARTHSTLLEEWRKQAAEGQRQARRVLAEMLTPSGGTKANCYKFISMVTGCGSSTISSVSHQMRVTKGDREPPEHGLKKWYRDNPRKKSKTISSHSNQHYQTLCSSTSVSSTPPVIMNCQESDSAQPNSVAEQSSRLELEQQRQQLEEAKQQLVLKQQELDHCQQIIDEHLKQSFRCNNGNCDKTWKVSVVKNTLKPEESSSDTTPVLVQEESGLNIIPNGDSVQLLDLIPGTYIAVPTDFSTSSFLTVTTADPKFTTAENAIGVHDNLSDSHVTLNSAFLHPVPVPSKSGTVAVASDLGVQTILNISSGTGGMNNILSNPNTDSHLGIHYVTLPPPECTDNCLAMGINNHCSSSPQQIQPLSSLESNNCRMTVSNPISNSSGSPCVSVITATGEVEPLKPARLGESSKSNAPHCSSGQDNLCETSSLSDVLLLPKPSDTHVTHALDTLGKFF